jgi:hypothetical protein
VNHRSSRVVIVVLIALAAMAMAACGGSSARSAVQGADVSEAVSIRRSSAWAASSPAETFPTRARTVARVGFLT